MIVLYSTSECNKCKKVADILDSNNIPYAKVMIDEDDDAKEELIMQNIFSVPAVKLENGEYASLKEIIGPDLEIDESRLIEIIGA